MSCQICFEASAPLAKLDGITPGVCRRSCPARVCVLCLARHVRVTLDGCYAGMLPVVRCPVCVTPMAKKCWYEPLFRCRATIGQSFWWLHYEYDRISERTCSLTAPCCKDVYYTHLPPARSLRKTKPSPQFVEYRRQVTRFCGHRLEARDVLAFAIDRFSVEGTRKLMDPTMERIADSERRARLMLEFLHMFPKTHTRCHRAEICFKCKRAGHQGACQDLNLAVVDPNKFIVRCRNCRLFVTKEGGCDHVICVCGFRMLWNNEVAQQEERRARGRPVLPNQRQSRRDFREGRRKLRRLLVQQRSLTRRVRRRR